MKKCVRKKNEQKYAAQQQKRASENVEKVALEKINE